ncbi:MAG: 16S rRNA (guanine(527)-N(7))-methyltransferase RsmG [Lentisphaerae bacterium]|nr:16S rRNA (guanine(527)-N(7))-methyltransferase RsmG [Lentisphaerota bacterium]
MITKLELNDFVRTCGVKDTGSFAAACEVLRKFLTEYNTNVNLTRLTSVEDFYFKHVADSLSIAYFFPEISKDKLVIADIGCGAGFPSLILALAFPQLQIHAIDSIGKKITFVTLAAQLLNLHNLNAVHGRSTELNCRKEFQNKFDIVTARAVAPSPKIFRESNRFTVPGGRFIFYKTPQQAAEESAELQKIRQMHWSNTSVFNLPGLSGERLFTVGKTI